MVVPNFRSPTWSSFAAARTSSEPKLRGAVDRRLVTFTACLSMSSTALSDAVNLFLIAAGTLRYCAWFKMSSFWLKTGCMVVVNFAQSVLSLLMRDSSFAMS